MWAKSCQEQAREPKRPSQGLCRPRTGMSHISHVHSFHFKVGVRHFSLLSVHALDETNLSGFNFNQRVVIKVIS